jgi:hypothetical protein
MKLLHIILCRPEEGAHIALGPFGEERAKDRWPTNKAYQFL